MKARSLMSVLLASLLLSTVASAQTPPPEGYRPDPPPPPSGPAVSEINGQLVKVGEHNEYLYGFRRWNVSTNPVGWVLGFYGVSMSYGFHPNIAIRGDMNYYSPVDSDVDGYELGVGVPIYLRRVYQGPFLEPGVIVRGLRSNDGDEHTEGGPQVLVGWHWSWDSGFNVAMAVGAGRNWANRSSACPGDGSYCEGGDREPIFVNGYLRFGYSF